MTNRHRNRVSEEILTLRHSLEALDRSLRHLSPMLSATLPANGAPKASARSRPRISANARASLVLQGRYIGYMRQLKPRQKAQVRKIRVARGVRMAIQSAREMARE